MLPSEPVLGEGVHVAWVVPPAVEVGGDEVRERVPREGQGQRGHLYAASGQLLLLHAKQELSPFRDPGGWLLG